MLITLGSGQWMIDAGTRTPQPFPSRAGKPQSCTHPLLCQRPEPNPPPVATLAVGTQHGVPSHAEVGECIDKVTQRPPELANLPPRQDCVPPPQVHPCLPAYPSFMQATVSRGADAERCCCRCGAGVTDDERNFLTGNRRTQRSCDRRTPHGSKKRIPTGRLVPRQACPKYARVQALS